MDCTCKRTGVNRTFVITKTRQKEKNIEHCPNRPKLELKLMGEQFTILKSSTKEQNITMLKKRASDDYKKNVHERKVDMTRKAINKFKDI